MPEGDSRREETALATRARQQAVVAEVGRRALSERKVPALMDEAVELVARTLDVEYAKVLELLPGGDVLLLRAGVGWKKGCVGKATVGAGLDSQAGYALASDVPVVAEDLSREDRFDVPPLLAEHGVKSSLTVLIRGDPEPYGVLGADSTRPRRFDDDDVFFLRAVANVLAEAVARARIEEELANRARQQAVVVELGRRALADSDVSVLMGAAVDLVARTLDVEHVEVLELLAAGDALVPRAGVGWKKGSVGARAVAAGADSQPGYTLASDAPVVVEDLSRESRFRVPRLFTDHGVVSGLSVVIGGPDHPWGVLGAHSTERRRFSGDDVNFLRAVAHVLAGALERAEMERRLRAAHDEERRLRERVETYSRLAATAHEDERRHIARELHDEVGQSLTGLKLTLDGLERLPPGSMDDRFRRARALVDELLERVHSLSLDLRPAVLDDLGLRPALLWLVQRFRTQTGLEAVLEHKGLDGRLSPELETVAYRIAQEALTNVARHAHTSGATLRCVLEGPSLVVEVTDEGVGFDVDAARPLRSGLVGMEERARLAGGYLRVDSQVGQGTRVLAELPVASAPRTPG